VNALATLVVVGRPGIDVDLAALRDEGWRVEHVDIPSLDVSSSDLRSRLAGGRPIDGLVPPLAVREIEKRGLYARGR
jgi:nicotinate-nucleotide adenylyltransferase